MQTDVRSVRAPEESARAFVYRVLSTYIKEMFLHPGEKLAETDVAAELQVSRTPVHDTFSRLERNKLSSVQRMEVSSDRMGGRDVLRTVLHADTDMIRQTVWMHRTVSQAVLGELYNHRPTTLEPLEHCVAAELEALQGGAIIKMARLYLEFHRTLYSMAGREPVMDVLERNSGDLYRLLRMMESADLWRYVAEQHSTVVQGLAMRDYEMAAHALEAEFDLVKPLLEECRYQRPYFFE